MTEWYNTLPLSELDDKQWEALCDGCGSCCRIKVWHGDTLRVANLACRYLDTNTAGCRDYSNRFTNNSGCNKVTMSAIKTKGMLPSTCAYVLRAQDQALPSWHYLVCGDRDAVHRDGPGVKGKKFESEANVRPHRHREFVDLDQPWP